MGLFDAPSGAKFCWVNDKYWRGSYDDSQQKCLDLGFTGLMEARDTEDARYAHVMNMCKIVDLFSTIIYNFRTLNDNFLDFYWWHWCDGPTTFTTPFTRWFCWYPPPGSGRYWKPWKYEKRHHSNPSPSEYRWFGGKIKILHIQTNTYSNIKFSSETNC